MAMAARCEEELMGVFHRLIRTLRVSSRGVRCKRIIEQNEVNSVRSLGVFHWHLLSESSIYFKFVLSRANFLNRFCPRGWKQQVEPLAPIVNPPPPLFARFVTREHRLVRSRLSLYGQTDPLSVTRRVKIQGGRKGLAL